MKYLLVLLLTGCSSVQRMTKEPALPSVPAQPAEASPTIYLILLWIMGSILLVLYLLRILKNDVRRNG